MTKCIVFDFDGVLIDSKRMYVELIKKALSENGIEQSFTAISEILIPSIIETSKLVVPEQIEEREVLVKLIERRVIELTASDGLEYTKISKDAKTVLEQLTHEEPANRIILLTNSHSDFIEKALNYYQLNQFFHEVFTLDSGFRSKDEAMRKIARTMECPESNIIYIGDTKTDVELAHRTGCKVLIVFTEFSWNFPNIQDILALKPDLITDSLSEVPKLLDLL